MTAVFHHSPEVRGKSARTAWQMLQKEEMMGVTKTAKPSRAEPRPNCTLVVLVRSVQPFLRWFEELVLVLFEAAGREWTRLEIHKRPHATVLGLEVIERGGVIYCLNASQREIWVEPQLHALIQELLERDQEGKGPLLTIQFGGFPGTCRCPDKLRWECSSGSAHSRGLNLTERGFAINDKGLGVAIGWPIPLNERLLSRLRRDAEAHNLYHIWHQKPGDEDNDLFVRVLKIRDYDAGKDAELKRTLETAGRKWLDETPKLIDIHSSDLSFVTYLDTDFNEIAAPEPIANLLYDPWYYPGVAMSPIALRNAMASLEAPMKLHFTDGSVVDAFPMALESGDLRCFIPGEDDTVVLKLEGGQWLTERGVVGRFEFATEQQARAILAAPPVIGRPSGSSSREPGQ
jgi:hypothetical protein